MKIVNLTQHTPTPEQIEAGVFDLEQDARDEIKDLLTFTAMPTPDELQDRAEQLVDLVEASTNATSAMIGGAPFFMEPLARELRARTTTITPLFAFSERESVEETLSDGTVRKTSIFRHIGFIEATDPNTLPTRGVYR